MSDKPPGAEGRPDPTLGGDAPPDRTPGGDAHPDPMAADKRVLIIGLVVMVALVGVGVISASLFAGSACRDITAEDVPFPVASTELDDVVSALDGIDGDAAQDLRRLVDDLAGHLGPLTGAADVSGATSLAPLGGGIAATGPVTVSLDAVGASVVGTAGFADPVIVVGSGDRLYSLALMNQITGQVDAHLPFDRELEPGTCVDTAVVGDPFAFHLDAAGGELLLLRVEEDADDPELELRDAIVGRRWMASLDVPVAPPGILAERVTAVLGDELIVAARRVIPGEDAPAAVGVAREDGERRWELPAATVGDAFGDDEPLWIEVVAVGDEVAVLAVAPDSDRDHAALLVVDVEDGAPAGRIDPGGARALIEAIHLDVAGVVVAWRDGEEVVLQRFGPEGERLGGESRWSGDRVAFAGGYAVTEHALLSVVDGEIEETARSGGAVRLRDVVRVGGVTSLLVEVGDEHAVVLTFGGAG